MTRWYAKRQFPDDGVRRLKCNSFTTIQCISIMFSNVTYVMEINNKPQWQFYSYAVSYPDQILHKQAKRMQLHEQRFLWL